MLILSCVVCVGCCVTFVVCSVLWFVVLFVAFVFGHGFVIYVVNCVGHLIFCCIVCRVVDFP